MILSYFSVTGLVWIINVLATALLLREVVFPLF